MMRSTTGGLQASYCYRAWLSTIASGQTVQTNGKGNYKADVDTQDGKRAMVSGSAHIVPDLDYDITPARRAL